MSHNLFIAYDLVSPGQNYEAVTDRIKSLGEYAHLQLSMFYVKSRLDMAAAHTSVRAVMDPNDRLAVIWANDAFIGMYEPVALQNIQTVFQRAA